MSNPQPSHFERIVDISERVSWRVDDVIRRDEQLDFSKPFLPEALAAHVVPFLSGPEQLRLNQIRACAYLHLFTFVEEYIIPTAVRHATAALFGDPWATRALLRFGDEELKHQQLFRRFGEAFARGFGSPCKGVDNAEEAAGFILRKSPLAVMLATLHFELITQAHFTDSVRELAEANAIDPLFASLLKHHWIEEAQHVKIDVLEIRTVSADAPQRTLDAALDDYAEILRLFDGVLRQQRRMDLDSLEAAIGRTLPDADRDALARTQTAAYRQAFLIAGVQHRILHDEIVRLVPDAGPRLEALAAELRNAP